MIDARTNSSMASQSRIYTAENPIDANRVAFEITDGKMDYARSSAMRDPNAAQRKVTQGELDFHKVGSARTGLEMNKIAQYDGQYYDSSTSEFAQIRAKEAADQTAVKSGLKSAAAPLDLNKDNAMGYKDRQSLDAWEKETSRKYAENMARPSSYGT